MNLLDLFVKVGYDDSDVDKGIEGTSKKGAKFGETLAKGFDVVTKAVGVISTGLVALGTAGINYNAQMEQYQTSFEVMLGNEEAAIALTEKLKQKAASTPFEMTDLANVTQLLLNYGITSDEVVDKMGMLGDISQGSADKLNRVASAYGQMSSLGKVQLEDIKQMIEAGFNPLQEISERTGESMDSLYERISKGTLSVDEITASMEASTSEGGKYFQSMEKQSLTFNGLMSTLKDTAMSTLGNITSGLSDIATSSILPKIIDYVTRLSTAFDEGGFEGLFSEFGTVLGDVFAQISGAAPKVIDGALSLLQSFVDAIAQNIATIVPAALNIITSIGMFIVENLPLLVETASQILVALATGIGEQAPTLIPAIVQTIITMIDTLIENAPMLVDGAIALMNGLAQGILAALPLLAQAAPRIILSLIDAIVNNLPTLLSSAGEIIVAIVQGIIAALPQLIEAVPQIIMALVQAFASHAPKIWDIGKNIVSGIWQGISNGTAWIKGKLKQWVGDVVKFIKSLFGINSPSTVMRDGVGKFLAYGVADGITDNLGYVKKSMLGMLDMVSSMDGTNVSMTGTLATESAYGGFGGLFGGVNVVNNFNQPIPSPIAAGKRVKTELESAIYG